MGPTDLGTLVAPLVDRAAGAPPADPDLSGPPGPPRGDVELRVGVVVDAFAYVHAVRVLVDGGGPMVASVGGCGSFGPVGVRDDWAPPPGASVLVAVPPGSATGVVVAVLPHAAGAPARTLPDFVAQGSRCGLRVDDAHRAVAGAARAGGLADWSAGRPYDALAGDGHRGWFSATGLRLYLDDAMLQAAVDEETGLFAFYEDRTARLAGRNLQIRSACREREELLDGGEALSYDGSTPYPWEAMGVEPGAGGDPAGAPPALRRLGAAEWQAAAPHYGAREPARDDQQPLHRVLALGGYPGQGGRRMVCAPPPRAEPGLRGYRDAAPAVGLWEEHVTLSGRYLMRSAVGWSLSKRGCIPAPTRRARPEAGGDDAANYRAAGLLGDGPPHRVAAAPDAGEAARPDLHAAFAPDEDLAYRHNWEAQVGLAYHERDWLVPEEADCAPGRAVAAVDYGAPGPFLPPPEPRRVAVDHRYGEVPVHPGTASVRATDEGAIALTDAWGSAIVMAGGAIVLSAPKGIWLQSGGDLQLWAGHDLVARARDSVDVSATRHDVRVKAQRHLHLLGGHDEGPGSGGGSVLLECRAPSASYDYAGGEEAPASGLVLRSRSDLALLAGDLYALSGAGGAGAGSIVLDAGRGDGLIAAHCDRLERHLGDRSVDYFGRRGEVAAAAWSSASGAALPGGLSLGGALAAADGGSFGGAVRALGGVSAPGGGRLGDLAGSRDLVEEAARSGPRAERDREAAAGADAYAARYDGRWHGPEGPAGPRLDGLGFAFRPAAQYRDAATFLAYAPPWMARAADAGAGEPWEEAPTGATAPYPGPEAWSAPTLRVPGPSLVDPAAGAARPRGGDGRALYESPRRSERAVAPRSGYLTL